MAQSENLGINGVQKVNFLYIFSKQNVNVFLVGGNDMKIIYKQNNHLYTLNGVVEYTYIARLKTLYVSFREVEVIIRNVESIEEV